MNKYLVILLPFSFFLFSFLQAQKGKNLYLSTAYHRGFVLPEYSNFTYIVTEPIHAVSVNLFQETYGKNIWQQLYGYPAFGLSVYAGSLGNAQVNGYELALFPYVNLAYPQRSRHVQGITQLGIGLGYASRKYSAQNYLNVAVGSHLNIHFNLKTGIRYSFAHAFQLYAGLSFDHLSNANLQEPNLGINVVTAYTSIAYLLGEKIEKQKQLIPDYQRSSKWAFFYFFGGKRARALASRYFITSSMSAEWNWKCTRIFHVGAGMDIFYDSSTRTEMEKANHTFQPKDNFRTGVHISQMVVYDKLSLILQEGIYLGLTDQVNYKSIYNKGIIQFELTPHWSLRLAMKSHLHILDYPEIGLGIQW